ncbi:hypothetical protein X777_15506 [Ooceraea biroi]|uniref:Uncharacterized protein n=1 Tax=Ooceraea biroi TaxID=2015173 RepID=A0A026VUP4_OOCBI|nr:hypothetical protein X777_15506 [Ooceraea biroi]
MRSHWRAPRYQKPAYLPYPRRIARSRTLNSEAGKADRRRLAAAAHAYRRRANIYLRNVFIEYYAAQVGNLVHGYAINERRSERDTTRARGRGREDGGGNRSE